MPKQESSSVDELWLETLQRLSARASHEIKGALNGAAVSLEVVRSRAGRADAPATSVSSFAEAAAGQLEHLTEMTEALLMLSRAPREPVEVGTTLAQLAAVLVPAARAEGFRLRVERPSNAGAVRVQGNAVRLVLGAALLAAIDRKGDVTCAVEADENAVVRIGCADGGSIELPEAVVAAAAQAGIHVDSGDVIQLSFPRAGRRAHEGT